MKPYRPKELPLKPLQSRRLSHGATEQLPLFAEVKSSEKTELKPSSPDRFDPYEQIGETRMDKNEARRQYFALMNRLEKECNAEQETALQAGELEYYDTNGNRLYF